MEPIVFTKDNFYSFVSNLILDGDVVGVTGKNGKYAFSPLKKVTIWFWIMMLLYFHQRNIFFHKKKS